MVLEQHYALVLDFVESERIDSNQQIQQNDVRLQNEGEEENETDYTVHWRKEIVELFRIVSPIRHPDVRIHYLSKIN